jgi:hemoglobin-like flavoprotein
VPLSPESEALVRSTWKKLKPASDTVVAAFYARLFEANPVAADLFKATNMVEQRRKFSAMLDEIVRVLDNPNLLVSEVAASGRRHVGYGVKSRDYDDVGAALVWAIGDSLGADFTPAVQAAWREAYALLAAVMRRAAARESGEVAKP